MRAWIVATLLLPVAIAVQHESPPTAPMNLSRADEIRYAKSAAPADISALIVVTRDWVVPVENQ